MKKTIKSIAATATLAMSFSLATISAYAMHIFVKTDPDSDKTFTLCCTKQKEKKSITSPS